MCVCVAPMPQLTVAYPKGPAGTGQGQGRGVGREWACQWMEEVKEDEEENLLTGAKNSTGGRSTCESSLFLFLACFLF